MQPSEVRNRSAEECSSNRQPIDIHTANWVLLSLSKRLAMHFARNQNRSQRIDSTKVNIEKSGVK
jgi:hypothetical protein